MAATPGVASEDAGRRAARAWGNEDGDGDGGDWWLWPTAAAAKSAAAGPKLHLQGSRGVRRTLGGEGQGRQREGTMWQGRVQGRCGGHEKVQRPNGRCTARGLGTGAVGPNNQLHTPGAERVRDRGGEGAGLLGQGSWGGEGARRRAS